MFKRLFMAFAYGKGPLAPEDRNKAYAVAAGLVAPLIPIGGRSAHPIGPKEIASLNKATELFEKVLELTPHNPAVLWLNGQAYQLLKQPAQAHKYLKAAAEEAPENLQYSVAAGLAAIQLGHPIDAIRFTRQALSLSPSDPELISNLALALLISSEVSQAVTLSSQALAMNPADNVARLVNEVARAVAMNKYPIPKNEAETIQIARRLRG